MTYPGNYDPKGAFVPYLGGFLLLWLLRPLQVTGKQREEAAQRSLGKEEQLHWERSNFYPPTVT